ncbi:hypothetical protein BTVI_133994 [Pitangus sulphuratus]|nr:hypothetical protein BTVI_133994 [Pitangus sulphuratus]
MGHYYYMMLSQLTLTIQQLSFQSKLGIQDLSTVKGSTALWGSLRIDDVRVILSLKVQKLDLMILEGPFQLGIFRDSVMLLRNMLQIRVPTLNKLKKWANGNFLRFNKVKSKAMHLSWGNAWYRYRLMEEQIDSSPEENLGMMVDERLDVTQQRVFASQKGSHVLGYFESSMGSRLREGTLPLYSALVRPHLECCNKVWGPQHRTDLDLFEWVQRRATKTVRGLEHLSCEEGLRELELFCLEKRRLCRDLIVVST